MPSGARNNSQDYIHVDMVGKRFKEGFAVVEFRDAEDSSLQVYTKPLACFLESEQGWPVKSRYQIWGVYRNRCTECAQKDLSLSHIPHRKLRIPERKFRYIPMEFTCFLRIYMFEEHNTHDRLVEWMCDLRNLAEKYIPRLVSYNIKADITPPNVDFICQQLMNKDIADIMLQIYGDEEDRDTLATRYAHRFFGDWVGARELIRTNRFDLEHFYHPGFA